MKKITIDNKEFHSCILSTTIKRAVENMAALINEDYAGKQVLFISILNGSFIFTSDLLKRINLTCRVSFVKLSSYHNDSSTGIIKEIIGLVEDISNCDVIILEDIVDTGVTIESIVMQLKKLNPASIKIATLLFKPQAFQKNLLIDYVGIEMPNGFLVGYGLDYNGFGRNHEDIYTLVEK